MPARSTPKTFYNQLITMPSGCLEWTGATQQDGYGIISYQRRFWLTHRLAWTLAKGKIPTGLCVCHTCDNPICCNHEHLFIGSHAENMADMRRKGRRKRINAGEYNGRAKLSSKQAAEIRHLYASEHIRQADLATRFDVSQTTVSFILLGKTWNSAT